MNANDSKKLIKLVNDKFRNCGKNDIQRSRIENASENLINFYLDNTDLLTAQVVIVRSVDDIPSATSAKNLKGGVLFIFKAGYFITSNFTTLTDNIILPLTVLKRLK